MQITESVHVEAGLDRTYAPFADLAQWPQILPDTLGADILYFDGYNQEFTMTVARPSGPETVRGVRYCRAPHELELVQTTPPPGFARMTGRWVFTPQGTGTKVTASRRFEVTAPVDGVPAGPDEHRIAAMLSGLLQTNLNLFRVAIEGA